MTSSVPITHLTALVVSRFEALTSAFMRSNVAVWSSLAAVAGVLSHVLYFIRGEHQKQALLLFKLFFWLPLVACLVLVQLFRMNVSHAVQSVAAITAAYTVSLWTSMIIYRSFFHRLHRFPGPPWAKTSKLYHAFQLGKRDNYRKLAGWHQTYGNFVRIGPGELSIISPNAAATVLGSGSPCLKSPWYDNGHGQPVASLQSIRDVQMHESRRRVWDRAFSMKSLRDYEGRVVDYTYKLLEQLSNMSGKPMNASSWFNYYSFDVMGDLAFGKSFDMLTSGKAHHIFTLFEKGMLPVGFLSPLPWIIPVISAAPFVGADFLRLAAWCAKQLDERTKIDVKVPDITSWLMKAPASESKWLRGDARLIVIAGSDTTAATMTFIFYHLASDPAQVEKLRAELQTLIKPDAPFNLRDIQGAEHLNGIINETLRMHPPVPSGTSRITPAEGITIDGVFVPGGINVIVPTYAIGRSEECYARPNDFIPERWYSCPELIKSKGAYAPFSLGPFGCIGKQLALMELRAVVGLLITRFDVSLAPGEDGTDLLYGSKDTFTVRLGDLMLVFRERGVGKGGEKEE